MHLKRRRKKKHFKLLFTLVCCYLLYQVFSYFLTDLKLVSGNEAFIKRILQDSNYHLLYEKQENNLVTKFLEFINGINAERPVSLKNNNFTYNDSSVFSYMENKVVSKPRVYIYSTHQHEEYAGVGLAKYDINPGVIMASYIMQDRLNNFGISTIVETRDVAKYKKEINSNYTYDATRHFLKTTLEENPDLDLIIDLHRDALSKDLSTTTINGKKYAKILFVMNPNYKDNINLVKRINSYINKNYPGLSRGIYDKYRDTFNQDLNKNALLLEVGGQHNTIDEVINTIDALVLAIKENI